MSRRPASIQAPSAPKPGTLRRRVYDGLESLLADTGNYPPGTKLPTYRALCQQYGVAQGAVDAAMEALASQGRVWIRPPLGVFVRGEGHEPTPTKAVLIAAAARERIADGTLKPGTSLVPLLAKEFETNGSVVSRALRPLADEGLLVVEPFSGTYVSPRPAPEPDHRVLPLNLGAKQATTPATGTLAPGSPYDRDGGHVVSSEDIPAVSPHLIGTSSRARAVRAAYQGVVDMLADTDTYPAGSSLPAQSVLADRLGVTSYALGKATRALEADGRVQRRSSRTIVLDKNSVPVPVITTARLTEIVREGIQDGTLKPGEPITGALMRGFGVGQTTVHRALTPLIADGLLLRKRGVGTYVPPEGTVVTEHDRAVLSPRKARLGAIVRSRIKNGTLKPGEPVIKQLMAELGVGRTTLQSALTPLIAEGLLVVRRGIGTYVPHPPLEAAARTCRSKVDTTPHPSDAARPQTPAADQ